MESPERNLLAELAIMKQYGIKLGFSELAAKYGKDRHTVRKFEAVPLRRFDGNPAFARKLLERLSLPTALNVVFAPACSLHLRSFPNLARVTKRMTRGISRVKCNARRSLCSNWLSN